MLALLRIGLNFAFSNPLGKLAGAALGLLALVSAFALNQQHAGARKQQARQGKVDANVVKNATDAARRSADPAARGVRDPNARAE